MNVENVNNNGANTDSILQLIDKLSNRLSILFENSISAGDCKTKLWQSLLTNETSDSNEGESSNLNGTNRMLFYCLELKSLNKDKKSDQLLYLCDALSNCSKDCDKLLEFLVNFKNETLFEIKKSDDYVSNDKFLRSKLNPDAYYNNEFRNALDDLSLFTRFISKTNDSFDMKTDAFQLTNECFKVVNEFKHNPYEQFHPENVLKRTKEKPSKYDVLQKLNECTLFTSLISKTVKNMEPYLDIPELPPDSNDYFWQIPTQPNYEWINYESVFDKLSQNNPQAQDEGFYSKTSSPITTSSIMFQEEKKSTSTNKIWDDALQNNLPDYYDWETKGRSKDVAYENNENKISLLDAPDHVFDQFYYNYLQAINTLSGRTCKIYKITQRNFILDCLYVLLSLPSKTFTLNNNGTFAVNNMIQISGISCEALATYAETFAKVGSRHKLLLKFIELPIRSNNPHNFGTVFRTFINAIKYYLNYYHSKIIITIESDISTFNLFSFFEKFKPYMDQLEFVCDVCKLDSFEIIGNTEKLHESCPRGLDLINYLYKLCKMCLNSNQNYLIILYFFKKTLKSFFRFIESWLFYGKYTDLYDEFMLDVNRNTTNRRDVFYWKHTYKIKNKYLHNPKNDHDNILGTLYQDIFNCGRSIDLLRICETTHFLCNNIGNYPRIYINFNKNYLNSIDGVCKKYKEHIYEKGKDRLKTRQEIIEEKLKLEQELILKAKLETERQQQIQKEKVEEERRIQRERKQKEFNKLKEQLEIDAQRKKSEKARAKQEDKEYMNKLVNRENIFSERQLQMEQEIKKEMIEEYEKLKKEAESREEKAKQRISEIKTRIETGDVDDDETKSVTKPSDTVRSESKENLIQSEIKTSKNSSRITDETTEPEQKLGIKLNEKMSATKESENDNEVRSHLKMVEGSHPSVQTNQDDVENQSKMKIESFKNKNTHGHASDSTIQSLLYDQQSNLDASISNNKDVKSDNEVKSNKEKEKESSDYKPHLKMVESSHHSIETPTAKVDDDVKKRLELFKSRNTHGHSSDSSVQNLLYPQENLKSVQTKLSPTPVKETITLDSSQFPPEATNKTHLKIVETGHHSVESNAVHVENSMKKRIDVFKIKNTHGHSSDSTLQSLLYPDVSKETTKKIEKNSESNEYVPCFKLVKTIAPPLVHETEPSPETPITATNNQIDDQKTHIKTFEDNHPSVETNPEMVDVEAKNRIELFKYRNYHGHSSDSTIQNLIYSDNTDKEQTVVQSNKSSEKPQNRQRLDDNLISQFKENQLEREKNKSRNESQYQSRLDLPFKTSIKMNDNMFASKQSSKNSFPFYQNYADDDEEYSKRWKQNSMKKKTYDWDEIFAPIIQPYDTDFEFNAIYDTILLPKQRNTIYICMLNEDIFEDINDYDQDELVINEMKDESKDLKQIFSFDYMNVEEILNRLIIKPIQIQTEIVNQCLINYFFVDLNLETHFESLRIYYLCENSEFVQGFLDYLCEKIYSHDNTYGNKAKLDTIFSPIVINLAFNNAKANTKNSKYLDCLSICMNTSVPNTINDDDEDSKCDDTKLSILSSGSKEANDYSQMLLDYFNYIDLKYKVDWPLNIVITELCLKKYNQLFNFILQIKFCTCSLNGVWTTLKRDGVIHKLASSSQFCNLQLFINEMKHYLNALQTYVHNQIILVGWEEFQDKLNSNVKSLDNLRESHLQFINSSLFRCFFSKKALHVFKIIKSILNMILNFRFQLMNDTWIKNEKTNKYEHRSFQMLAETYRKFRDLSDFLFKVLQSHVSLGYELHMKTLELTLNFNNFYGKDKGDTVALIKNLK